MEGIILLEVSLVLLSPEIEFETLLLPIFVFVSKTVGYSIILYWFSTSMFGEGGVRDYDFYCQKSKIIEITFLIIIHTCTSSIQLLCIMSRRIIMLSIRARVIKFGRTKFNA